MSDRINAPLNGQGEFVFDADDNEYYLAQQPIQQEGQFGFCCNSTIEVQTAYGSRRTCNTHRRVWTSLLNEGKGRYEPWVEEKYTGFGVMGNG